MNRVLGKKPELVVSAGDWESLSSALDAGSDSVYFGIKDFNLRINAKNFEINQIPSVIKKCRVYKAKAYLTLNSIIYNNEITKLKRVIHSCAEYGVDAIICWDFAAIDQALEASIPVHLSTQASVSNFSSLLHFYKLGIKRVILARECSLDMIKNITSEIKRHKMDMIIEVFVHGALCISISGRCFISEYLFGRSANRGDCLQPCRRKYHIKDIEEEGELEIEDGYILSPKDLCTVDILDKLIEAGVSAFKIEGRTRPCDYIKKTTAVYRGAIDDYFKENLSAERKEMYINELRKVYNRGFSHGFYLGKPINDLSGISGSKAEQKKIYVGDVIRYFKKINVAEVILRNGDISMGDSLLFTGKNTGTYMHVVGEMESNHQRVMKALKGNRIAIKTDRVVRKNDKVFILSRRGK